MHQLVSYGQQTRTASASGTVGRRRSGTLCLGLLLSLLLCQGAAIARKPPPDSLQEQADRLGLALPTELVRSSLRSKVLKKKVEYAVLLPPGYRRADKPLPLLLYLHGAMSDREYLALERPTIEAMWSNQEVPEFVVATVSAGPLSFYVDADGKRARWESFLMKEFLPYLRKHYAVSSARKDTLVTGISMGGFGSAMLAFRHLDAFGAVAMMEPAIWPALTWSDLDPYQQILPPALMKPLFGDPAKGERWSAHNPASIVANDPERIRKAGLAIYLECGDVDSFGFHEGAEFLHRILWDHKIPHEYRLVRHADHVGPTIPDRSRNRFAFIGRYLRIDSAPGPAVQGLRERRGAAYRRMGYQPFPFWPHEARLVDD